MSAVAEGGLDRIGIGWLVMAGLGRLRAAWLPMLAATLAALAASYAVDWLLPMDTRLARLEFTPVYFARAALNILAQSATGALALWWLLTPRSGPPRAARAVVECMAVLCLYDVASVILQVGVNPAGAMAQGATAVGIRGAMVGVGRMAIELVAVVLCLWPVGRLAGYGATTPARAWRLMHGARLSFLAVVVILTLPAFLAPLLIGMNSSPETFAPNYQAWGQVQWVWNEAMRMLGLAFAVAIFVRRAPRPGSVGDVFA